MANTNKVIQKIDQIESYMKDKIAEYYPMKVQQWIVFPDIDMDGDLTAVFRSDTGGDYSMVISEKNGLPLLLPFVQA